MSTNSFSVCPAPARFEAGTPAIVQAIGLGAEIDYIINDIGMDRIQHDYEVELANYLRTRLNDVKGVTIDRMDESSSCAFVSEAVHPSDLGTFLNVEGVAKYELGITAVNHSVQPWVTVTQLG